jgi:hypothetical protein
VEPVRLLEQTFVLVLQHAPRCFELRFGLEHRLVTQRHAVAELLEQSRVDVGELHVGQRGEEPQQPLHLGVDGGFGVVHGAFEVGAERAFSMTCGRRSATRRVLRRFRAAW